MEDRQAPASHVEVAELVGNEGEGRSRRRARVLVEVDRSRALADEEVEVSVPVDVAERGRGVAAAGEREQGGVGQRERDRAVVGVVAVQPQLVLPGADHGVQVSVRVQVAEGRDEVVSPAEVELPREAKRRGPGRALVLEAVQGAVLGVVLLDLVADEEVEVAVPVEVDENRHALAAHVDRGDEARGDVPEAARAVLAEPVEVVGGRRVGVEGAPEHADEEVRVAVAVGVPQRRRVVAAGAQGIFRGEGDRLAAQVRGPARARVLEQEHAGLEVVTPEEILVAVAVDVAEGHRVRAVQAPDLRDDLDVLEAVGDLLEARHAVRVEPGLLVAGHGALEAPDEQVDPAVAVDVGGVGDVLAVGEDRLALRVLEAVGREHEARLGGRALVAVVADVAEELLAQDVHVPVAVEVDEAIPLADLEVVVAIGAPHEGRRAPDVLEEHHLARRLLHEQVVVAVAVDVHELRSRDVEPAEKGLPVIQTVPVPDRERRDPPHQALFAHRALFAHQALFARRTDRLRAGSGGAARRREPDEHERPPPPKPCRHVGASGRPESRRTSRPRTGRPR